MGKIKTKSLKSSMTATFLITICVIAVLSAITILASNHLQQEILKKRYLMINSPNFQIDEGTGNYVLDVDSDNITWQPLSTRDNIAYIHNAVMKIPRTPEEVRGDFLRSIISVFENFVSRHIILVGIDNCAFKFVTCSYAYGVNDIVTYTVGIRAVGHCNEQVVGLDYLDFVDCNEAVNCQRSDCFQGSVREGPSEFDV